MEGKEDGGFVEAPGGADKVIRRGVAADAFDDHVGWEELQKIDEGADVVVARHECDFAAGDLVGEGCILDGVKVVDFYGVQVEAGDLAGRSEHVVVRFAGEAEDDVAADFEAAILAALDGVDCGVVM